MTCFAYEDVMRDPLGQFTRLAEIGWPIDRRAAAYRGRASLDASA